MKKRFLSQLENYLSQLSVEERQEILDFYEERFETSMRYEGKTEEEVIDELESPRQIATNVLNEYGYGKIKPTVELEPEPGINAWSIVLLILFDVFIAAFMVPLLFGLFAGFGTGLLAFIGATFLSLFTPSGIQTIWGVFVAIGFAYFWLLFVLWLYDLLIGFIVWLVRWHLEVFRMLKSAHIVKSLKKLQVSSFMKRYPGFRRLKNFLAFVAIIFVFVGGIMAITTTGTFRFDAWNEPLETKEYSHDVSGDIIAGTGWTITSDLDLGYVSIVRNGPDMISVLSKERESVPVTVTIDPLTQIIHVENTMPRTRISFGFILNWFDESPGVTIEIPEGLIIDEINLKGLNGAVTVENIELDTLTISTTNAIISLRHIQISEDVVIRTTNGTISLRYVSAETIDVKTTNGLINFRDIEAKHTRAQTTNGEIKLTDLNNTAKDGLTLYAKTTNGKITLEEVYVLDVELSNTNGNINYTNTDLTFILDRVAAQTTNGRVEKNVPVQP